MESTLIYTQMASFEEDEYHVKTAKGLEIACELAETGFVGVQGFRKRK